MDCGSQRVNVPANMGLHFYTTYLISFYFISCVATACDVCWSRDKVQAIGFSSYSIERYISELSVEFLRQNPQKVLQLYMY